ncbi:hypothetical protein SNOG_10472 [Parastagonospora nodorum SN15]|uniref:Uncharacterized protein n=1 Tax=Phaeosphaeria nodorum (strain SN15 / ATCC MYA-4574 / FGSC 10173) TaxID=321614 RepID=Q0UCP2_PHANO|nr:hypothetical protein SNOG_10472 [Parastagonospora nodorum SN15]EAT81866.1 hypothetical protein SNOG_10472 [Parastagonospora nodorum SN15]
MPRPTRQRRANYGPNNALSELRANLSLKREPEAQIHRA